MLNILNQVGIRRNRLGGLRKRQSNDAPRKPFTVMLTPQRGERRKHVNSGQIRAIRGWRENWYWEGVPSSLGAEVR
jgi:hypothetical protein